jgi:hypothetical protein
MDGHDRRGSRGDARLNRLRIETEVVRLYVGEDRRRPGKSDRVRGRCITERRHNDLVAGANAGGKETQMQSAGAGVYGDAVPAAY